MSLSTGITAGPPGWGPEDWDAGRTSRAAQVLLGPPGAGPVTITGSRVN